MYLHALTTRYVYFFPFQLPSLVHPSLLGLLPTALSVSSCKLCLLSLFFQGKVPLLLIKTRPRFNTATPPSPYPPADMQTVLASYTTSCFAAVVRWEFFFQPHSYLFIKKKRRHHLKCPLDWMRSLWEHPHKFAILQLGVLRKHRDTQVPVSKVDSSSTCLPAVCCPWRGEGVQPSDWQVRSPGAASHNTAGLAQMLRRDKNPLYVCDVCVCFFFFSNSIIINTDHLFGGREQARRGENVM